MNRNYIRGRAYEYRAMGMLEEEGYKCQRGAGSHSVDIIAWLTLNNNLLELPIFRFIEVKSGHYNKKNTILELQSKNIPSSVSVEIWHFTKGKRFPEKIIVKNP